MQVYLSSSFHHGSLWIKFNKNLIYINGCDSSWARSVDVLFQHDILIHTFLYWKKLSQVWRNNSPHVALTTSHNKVVVGNVVCPYLELLYHTWLNKNWTWWTHQDFATESLANVSRGTWQTTMCSHDHLCTPVLLLPRLTCANDEVGERCLWILDTNLHFKLISLYCVGKDKTGNRKLLF